MLSPVSASSEDPKDFISTRNFEGGKDEKQHNKNIDNIKQGKKTTGVKVVRNEQQQQSQDSKDGKKNLRFVAM